MALEILPATFIRDVDPSEPWHEVVNEAKGLTWSFRREHALLQVEPDRLVLVSGGADGIEFHVENGVVIVLISGIPRRVKQLAWHTHPRPTGPSDHDRKFLEMLGQRSSMIYEMFAGGEGTRFDAKGPRVSE
jgi:hypothetical protein